MADQSFGPLQMPGPMNDGDDERGFDPTGVNMAGLAPMGEFPVGVTLPGDPSAEQGFDYGRDLQNMAEHDDQPDNAIGVESDDGNLRIEDFARSAGFRVIGPMTGNTGSLEAGDILQVFDALENSAGARPASDGSIPGIDSLRGIPLGHGSGPIGSGEESTYSTADGDR